MALKFTPNPEAPQVGAIKASNASHYSKLADLIVSQQGLPMLPKTNIINGMDGSVVSMPSLPTKPGSPQR